MGLITRRAALAGAAAAALAPPSVRAAPGPALFRRGVNAFPWFQLTREYPAPRKDYPSPPFQPGRPVPDTALLQRLRTAGFDFLRVPVDPGPFLAASSIERRALLRELMGAVDLALSEDLGVVVNVQANAATHYWTPARMTASLEAPEFSAYLALCGDIAAELARRPQARVALEPINEPRGACDSLSTAEVRRALLQRARLAAPALTLVASGGCGSLIQGLADFDPASIAEFAPLIYTVHFYEPYVFSHQGAPWMGERLYHTLADVPWPASEGAFDATLRATRTRIEADASLSSEARGEILDETEKVIKLYFDANPARPFVDGYLNRVAAWADRNKLERRRVLIGEFGALRRDARYFGARAADRARYVRDVRESAEALGFPWAFWCLFDGMGVIGEGRDLDPAMIAALGLRG